MVLLESSNVPLGTSAQDFSLKGVDEQEYSLSSFVDASALVIVFMCNHCPYVQAQWKRLVSLQDKFKSLGIRFVGINPNSNPDYPEDSFDKMKEYAKEYEMNFPYLQDPTQEVAKNYNAQCTPDIFVYDKDQKLAYHGRVDDSWKDEAVATTHELNDVLEVLSKGNIPEVDQHPSMGCSIKWLD